MISGHTNTYVIRERERVDVMNGTIVYRCTCVQTPDSVHCTSAYLLRVTGCV